MFVVGIGKNVNKSMINSLASEPVNKHALFVPTFNNLDSSVSRNILKTVEKTPLPMKVILVLIFSFSKYTIKYYFIVLKYVSFTFRVTCRNYT